jgi:hypothetical protein
MSTNLLRKVPCLPLGLLLESSHTEVSFSLKIHVDKLRAGLSVVESDVN